MPTAEMWPKALARAGTSRLGVPSSTWWPSSSQSLAASMTAATHSGSRGTPDGASVLNTMRSGSSSAPTSSRYGRRGAGAMNGSPGSPPAVASSRAAESRTEIVRACSERMPPRRARPWSRRGEEVRMRVGFRPNTPQQAAGTRIDPPLSLPLAIGAMRSRDGGGGPAAGAAGHAVQVPRVVGGPVQLGLGGGLHAELGQVGLGAGDEAGGLVAPGDLAVGVGHVVGEVPAATRGHLAGVSGTAAVLEQERHAAEGTVGEVAGGHPRGLLLHGADDGVDLRVDRLDATEGRLQQLEGADFARPDHLGLSQAVTTRQIGHGRIRHQTLSPVKIWFGRPQDRRGPFGLGG